MSPARSKFWAASAPVQPEDDGTRPAAQQADTMRHWAQTESAIPGIPRSM